MILFESKLCVVVNFGLIVEQVCIPVDLLIAFFYFCI